VIITAAVIQIVQPLRCEVQGVGIIILTCVIRLIDLKHKMCVTKRGLLPIERNSAIALTSYKKLIPDPLLVVNPLPPTHSMKCCASRK
jgi:hypothetical protein